MTRVTAVIPVYRPGRLLERSLGSVLRQTHQDLEVLVVDDGSPEDFIATPGLDDGRVKLLHQPNRGVSAARNRAVWAATGEYVAFLDQDDEWLPRKIEQQLAAADAHPEAAFIHTGFDWVLPDRTVHGDASDISYLDNLTGHGHVCLSTVMVRAEYYAIAGGSDISMAQQQDWDMVLKLLRVFGPAVGIGETLARYFVHGDNASADYARSLAEAERLYAQHLGFASGNPGELTAIKRGRAATRRRCAAQAVEAARRALALHDLAGAVRHLTAAGRIDGAAVPQALQATLVRRLRATSSATDSAT